MYKEKTPEQYKALSLEQRATQLQRWLEDQLDNHQSVIRSIAGTTPESDPNIDNVLGADFKELPTMINDYEEGSIAKFLLKHRLQNNLTECNDSLLDLDDAGRISVKLLHEGDSEENIDIIRAHKTFAYDMIVICKIFGFEGLQKSFEAWCP
jgi:hypothetical protein